MNVYIMNQSIHTHLLAVGGMQCILVLRKPFNKDQISIRNRTKPGSAMQIKINLETAFFCVVTRNQEAAVKIKINLRDDNRQICVWFALNM